MEHLLKELETQRPAVNPLTRIGKLGASLFTKLMPAAPAGSNRFKEMTGLSVDSAMTLRKVQRSLNDNWAAVKAIQPHHGKSKRWSSEARHLATVETFGKTANNGQTQPAVEEIRGLDDIFPEPISGIFEEPAAPQPGSLSSAIQMHLHLLLQPEKEMASQPRRPVIKRVRRRIETPVIQEAAAEFTRMDERDLTPDDTVRVLAMQAESTGFPREGVSDASAKQYPGAIAPPPKRTVREQLDLDQELEGDLSSFDYLLRNNKILSSSITSLAEQYFLYAALEEETV